LYEHQVTKALNWDDAMRADGSVPGDQGK